MGWNTRGHPYGQVAASQDVEEISTVPCGVISVVLVGDGTNLATVTVYDNADEADYDAAAGVEVVSLQTTETTVYTPSKPDACSRGCVVKTGANSKATISVE
jgi:hypothetical protein